MLLKIGILRPLLGVGGAGVSLTEMASVLKQRGHTVWLGLDAGVDSTSIAFNEFGILKERINPKIKELFHDESAKDSWILEQLKNTDIIILVNRHLFSKDLIKAVNNVKVKIVYAPGKNPHHITGVTKRFTDGSKINNLTSIIFNSKDTLKLHLSKDYSQDFKKIFKHIYPPMDIDYYQELYDKTKQKGKNSYLSVGIFGRLIESKQPLRVLEFAKALPNFHFFFIGDGPLRKTLEEKVQKDNLSNRIKILGMLDNPFYSIAEMDLILHLCEHESFSRALREAMFFEKPVFAFNKCGNIELCSEKLSDLLFNSIDEAITKLKSIKIEELSEYGSLARSKILYKEFLARENFINFIENNYAKSSK